MPAVPEPPREGVSQQRNALGGSGEEPAAPGTWSAPSAPAHAWHAPNGAWSQQMPPAPQAPPQPPPVVPVQAWDARPAPLQQPGPDPSMVRPSRAARHEVQRKPRQKGIRARRAWPVRLALFGAIAALMLLCWFVVFPWLETVLPSEF
jgi:hypothetical protein